MNTPTSLNLTVKRNDTIKKRITVKINGVVEDITGWKFYFTVKTNKTDSDDVALIKVDWTTHTDPTNGVTLLTVPKESTNLTDEKYYDVQVKNLSDEIFTAMDGKITFDLDITQRTS